ncbi:hypothetical protein D3C78_1196700 [compost metagenome]
MILPELLLNLRQNGGPIGTGLSVQRDKVSGMENALNPGDMKHFANPGRGGPLVIQCICFANTLLQSFIKMKLHGIRARCWFYKYNFHKLFTSPFYIILP